MNKPWKNGVGGLKNGRRLLPVIAIITLGFAGMGANSVGAGNPPVPFKSSVSGTLTSTGPSTVKLTGTGNASHLGRIDYNGTVQISSQTPTQITDDLTETLTAANGDKLTLLCHQVANLTSQKGVYESTADQWTVISGTGRFSGATGSGSGTTHVDFNSNTFTKDCTGTITY